ncbi:hypothetical protein NN3_25200 [Nocardia neocaledoniensis NBRC 108232]|uniref:hypothetical protein n=1 Tax=Nocardia neocaledoniensis TaxID=236511 RepID=UPI0011944AF0|nr:hypothetical protein [Nocardia neocaledoniensis]GEM31513.1 hypothetical protein NN3_25200 [Nocardia neocaledoniensis NBRC 108232]
MLRAAALEYEGTSKFGTLNQLLHPLLAEIDDLSSAHRQALSVVMGLAPGAAPPQLITAAATLALLKAAATQSTPLLLIVDDVQWAEADDGFTRSGFPVHDLRLLDEASSDQLLRSTFPALSARVGRQLRADASGNPLALLGTAYRIRRRPLPHRSAQRFAADRAAAATVRRTARRSTGGHPADASVRRSGRGREQLDALTCGTRKTNPSITSKPYPMTSEQLLTLRPALLASWHRAEKCRMGTIPAT